MQIMKRHETESISATRKLLFFFGIMLSLLSMIQSKGEARAISEVQGKKIACFLADDFPTVDAPRIDPIVLRRSLREFDVEYIANVDSVSVRLTNARFKELVLPYGSAFPVQAWPAIYDFLLHGGSLVVLGGSPFHQPVIRKRGKWVFGTAQPTYAHRLLIGPADLILLNSSPFYNSNSSMIVPEGSDFDASSLSLPTKVYELTVRFTTRNDYANEIGTAGPRDAVMLPLVHIVNGNGLPVASPLVEIDRLLGDEAGGRWILETSDAVLSASAIEYCVGRALEGSARIESNPFQACVDENGIPEVRVNEFRPLPDNNDLPSSHANIVVSNSQGKQVFESSLELRGTAEFKSGIVQIRPAKPLEPGFYKVEVGDRGAKWRPHTSLSAFWIRDTKLMSSGPHLSVSRDWLLKDGKVFPIIGTSYMAADAGRKFLMEPNPYLWEADFARMENLGINFVRVGLWTGWQKIVLDPGAMDEGFLRSLDALIHTAARHNIVICFNLFAFLPPANGGTNPYLDPRAIEWQHSFVSLIASRYKNTGWINYDLINEPSYSPPDKIWKELPIGDEYERAAWNGWLTEHHRGDPAETLDNWRDGSGDLFSMPGSDELAYQQIREYRRPRKGLDFELFSQDVITQWAGDLRGVIRSAGGDHLVTLGQDEGGMSLRSSQQFHFPSVDYTSMHTWWLNDHLLWDAVSSKVPEKPNLISETGLMRLENIDGEPWRSPLAARELLERKFAYAFQGRGAGVVEWCWNINEFMTSENEVGIGLTRADGTMKIETEVIKEYSDFFSKAAPFLGDYEKDSVLIVIPDARLFSGLPDAMTGVQMVVRTLADNFGIVPTLLSEFKLSEERLRGIKLVIVPDAGMISDTAAVQLYAASLNGTKVLFTGAVEGNEYGKQSRAFLSLGLSPESHPVSHYESTHWSTVSGDRNLPVTFSSGKSEYLRKSNSQQLDTLRGNVLNEPLPIELAAEKEPVNAMLDAVLKYAGIHSDIRDTRVATRILVSGTSALIVCVNESSVSVTRQVSFGGHWIDIPVEAGRTRLVLVERRSGKIIAATDGEQIGQK